MRNNVFMNLVEYERKRKKYKEDIEMAIILIVAGICTALILAR